MKTAFVILLMALSGLVGYHTGRHGRLAETQKAFNEGMREARSLENGYCKYCGRQYPTADPDR